MSQALTAREEVAWWLAVLVTVIGAAMFVGGNIWAASPEMLAVRAECAGCASPAGSVAILGAVFAIVGLALVAAASALALNDG